MLKRLELIGFKSFADRTRFEFAPGVTAIVGPNGSGKSNVVDAVRWLLGEQSAKSLRGGEMSDVIFNGSSTRKSLGLAEVTMTFDNTRRVLDFDADEVQVTRRVYRDGVGEYLINAQMSRLKDVKDLFLGSGAGHGAYSVIEQGRVDAMLGASPKDRRAIFEEAAGISRFKARKAETLRKLERVDADLVRVHDILQELDKQLRTLRLQASKAERYQEYTNRLRDVRVSVACGEYQQLTASLAVENEHLTRLRGELAEATTSTRAIEERLKEFDWNLTRTEEHLRHQEGKLSEARQQMAAQEAITRTERQQIANLEADTLRLGKQRAELTARIRSIEAEAARIHHERQQTEAELQQDQLRAEAAVQKLDAISRQISELNDQAQEGRRLQFELVGRLARLTGDAETAENHWQRLQTDQSRKRAESERIASRHDALARLLEELSATDADVRQRLDTARQAVASYRQDQERLRQQADDLQPRLDAAREERSALRGRADILEDLERSHEGIGAGVQAVLQRVRSGETPLAGSMLGLVADLVTVPHEVAPLIDLALGDVSQRFVLQDQAALSTVLATLDELPGRVSLYPLTPGIITSTASTIAADFPSVVLASSLVACDVPGLCEHLLGRVLIVPDLAQARAIVSRHPGWRAVTRQGEVVEADGTVVVGSHQAGSGLLSRKSELRDIHRQIARLEEQIASVEAEQSAFRQQAEQREAPIQSCELEMATLAGEAGSLHDQMLEQRQVQRQLSDHLALLASELALLERELNEAQANLASFREQATAAQREAGAVKDRLVTIDEALAQAERDKTLAVEENTAAQVMLSRINERLASLARKRDDLDSEFRQRRIDGVNLASSERSLRAKLQESQLAALRASALAADAYADKELREQEIAACTGEREQLRAGRDQLAEQLRHLRETWKGQQDQAHAHELTVRDLTTRQSGLIERLREEYAIDLTSETNAEASDATIELTLADPAKEIEELRGKIARLGQVNLEALAELAEVEQRAKDLRSQFDDLSTSRDKLKQIIEQINTDSRQLFSSLLESVRAHFQELFRKLFGGGMADIILDGPDILEAGIDITARPPGKELQRISLLSGGERALTAVALLLAIFRSKPSPFCLLDEVDAAMDEANTQRLASLLREFADRSQFVVITHKKRTMSVADVLYGVTMQESGVSKLVTVRFEDWPEDVDVVPMQPQAA